MRKVNYIVGAVVVLLIVFLTAVRSPQKQGPPSYNAAAEVQVSGTVQEVREYFCAISEEQGTHLLLHSNQGDILVHVAPARFLRTQQFAVHANDAVSVVGTRVHYQGEDAILAREVTLGNEVLIVRDRQGHPLWTR